MTCSPQHLLKVTTGQLTDETCPHTYLLGYEVQPAFEGIGDLDFAIPVVDLNPASSTKNTGNNVHRFEGNRHTLYNYLLPLENSCLGVWMVSTLLAAINICNKFETNSEASEASR